MDKHYIGLDLTSFEDNGKLRPISRVTLFLDSDNYVTAGDDTGYELKADCPHGTQAMADALLEKYKGFQYQQYQAGSARLDPLAELGDGVTVGGVYSMIAETGKAGERFQDVSAPGDEELEDEYPSEGGPMTQQLERQLAQNRSEIAKTAESITLTVEEVKETAESASEKVTKLEQTVDGLTLEASSFVSEDLFAGVAWTKGTTVTSDGSALFGTALYTPADKLEGLNKKTITVSLEYKAESGENNGSNILLWTNYSSGNVSTRIALPTQIKEAKDWTKSTVTVQINDEGPTSFYLWAYTNANYAGSFSVRNATAYIRDNQSSKLTLKSGETVLSSANIVLNGIVTFQNLETAGETIINGDNIITGKIKSSNGNLVFDLNNNRITVGSNSIFRVGSDTEYADFNGGAITFHNTKGDVATINANYWYPSLNRYITGFWGNNNIIAFGYRGDATVNGMEVRNWDNEGYPTWFPQKIWVKSNSRFDAELYLNTGVNINIESVSAGQDSVKLGTAGGWNDRQNLIVRRGGLWVEGSIGISDGYNKNKVVRTRSFGAVGMEAVESAIPIFIDNGSGVLDETGKCYLQLSPVFEETVSDSIIPQWHITGSASMTVHKDGRDAVVNGPPGETFDWICIVTQRGFEADYAEQADLDCSDLYFPKDYTAEGYLDEVNEEIENEDFLENIDMEGFFDE